MTQSGTGASAEPLVSIGLPVFNGEEFLGPAIECLLDQSVRDLELVISDNASTDGTAAICRRYAERDPRVRYSRLPRNVGGVPNANRVFSLARGRFFMWAAHDDLWEPTYLECCLQALRADPGAVLAFSEMAIIDETGATVRMTAGSHTAASTDAATRLTEFLAIDSISDAAYSVIRTDVLRTVRPFVLHPGSDRILLAELALRGRFIRLPEYLYKRRQHSGRSVKVYPRLIDRYAWVSPDLRGRRMFPHWGYLRGFVAALWRAPVKARDRIACGVLLAKWIRWYWRRLAADFRAGRVATV